MTAVAGGNLWSPAPQPNDDDDDDDDDDEIQNNKKCNNDYTNKSLCDVADKL